MANVAILNNKGELVRYLKSVHTPDYLNRPDCLINPSQETLDSLLRAQPKVKEQALEMQLTQKKLYGILKHLKKQGIDLGPMGKEI